MILSLSYQNKVIQNPPNSPDLNVLDYHTWNHMDQMVQQCENIKTLSDLKREVVRAYMNINMDEIKKSVDTWEKRLRACLAAGGNRFEYRLEMGQLSIKINMVLDYFLYM